GGARKRCAQDGGERSSRSPSWPSTYHSPKTSRHHSYTPGAMNITPLLMAVSMLAGTEQMQPTTTPTATEATQFVNDAEAKLAAVNVEQQRASWVAENFITYDTQLISAAANEKQIALGVELAKQAARFDSVPNLPADTRRKLDLIKLALTTPGPSDPAGTAEMARIGAEMDAMYGAGKYCPPGASAAPCRASDQVTPTIHH